MLTAFDLEVRGEIYDSFSRRGRAPGLDYLRRPDVADSLQRLAEAHVVVLNPDGKLRMAMPFSNVPTAFSVTWERQCWWANCAWDALGIGVALGLPVAIETFCPDCGETLRATDDEVVHVANPAARWWADIVDT
ncbi:MAG TPA: organomercurial lyase [Candidatus Xenobia bacterium]|jgi:hypothetical protein